MDKSIATCRLILLISRRKAEALLFYGIANYVPAEPGWNSILVLLESCLQTSMTCTIAECTVNKLMMDRGTVRDM